MEDDIYGEGTHVPNTCIGTAATPTAVSLHELLNIFFIINLFKDINILSIFYKTSQI
jgi:hypothetical protein